MLPDKLGPRPASRGWPRLCAELVSLGLLAAVCLSAPLAEAREPAGKSVLRGKTQQTEALPKAAPQAVGLSPDRLARIAPALQAEVDAGRMPGAVFAIARKGRLVALGAVGFRDKEAGDALKTDAIFSIASMTKPMTSVAALMLYEEGRLLLSDPVSKHLPAMKDMKVGAYKTNADGKSELGLAPVEREMTVQDLLRHTSGLTYREFGRTDLDKLAPPAASPATMTGAEFIEALAKTPLRAQPGHQFIYSLSTDVLGLVVEKAAGKSLGAFLSERVWSPLGMTDTGFVIPAEKTALKAMPFATDQLASSVFLTHHAKGQALKFECGGACAVSTALDYLRFAEMLRRGGTFAGKRILSRKTVELMTANHLNAAQLALLKPGELAAGYGFGLGVATRLAPGVANLAGSQGDFDWSGAFGTTFWVDPKEELSVVFMSQQAGLQRILMRQLVRTLVMAAIAD